MIREYYPASYAIWEGAHPVPARWSFFRRPPQHLIWPSFSQLARKRLQAFVLLGPERTTLGPGDWSWFVLSEQKRVDER